MNSKLMDGVPILDKKQLQILLNRAISAAEKAGALISDHTQREIAIKTKIAGDSLASQVVTEVDQKAQEIILNELRPTLAQFDIGLLTEESQDDGSRFQKEYFWCIDPLDGTLPFTEKKPGYAVSIALVAKDGIPIIGVVYDPVTKNLYHAIKGKGAFKNRETLITGDYAETFTIVFDRSFPLDPRFDETVARVKLIANQLGYKNFKEFHYGGGVINSLYVLENGPACYLKLPVGHKGGGSLWDYAATACIFNETAAAVSDIYGNSLDLNRKDSTFLNHRGVLFASDKELALKIQDALKTLCLV